MRTIEQEITGMLIECTGTAMCDSGGAYGRNWEINKGKTQKDFEAEDAVRLEFDEEGAVVCYTISLYHYLTPQLDLNEICHKFNQINTKVDNWDDNRFYGVSKEGGNYLDLVGFGNSEHCNNGFNSYNGESNLSQVIQGTHITINDTFYLLLQVHGGCDVRGGYTDAKLFTLEDDFLQPEDVFGMFTPTGTDLKTPCFSGEVNSKVAGVIEFSNCYDGYSLNRIHNDWREFELNKNKGKIEVYLCVN